MRAIRALRSFAVFHLAVVAPIAAQEASFEAKLEHASRLLASNPRGALAAFSELERSRPESCIDCLLGMASAQIRLDGFVEAEKLAGRVIELSSDPAAQMMAHSLLGLSFYERTPLGGAGREFKSNMTQAEAAFRRAYELDRSRDETSRWNLASALEWLGRADEANALFSDPSDAVVGEDLSAREASLVKDKVQKPVRISDLQPQYSPRAKRLGVQGEVILEAVISDRGVVTRVKVLKGLRGCTLQAIPALRQCKFQPATLEGEPVSVYFTLTVKFNLGG